MLHRKRETQAIYDRMKPERIAFLEECHTCAVCNMRGSEHVHEILCGTAHRMNAFQHRCCWLGVCSECHRMIQSCVTIARQLAWKVLQDPYHFDIVKFHEVWGRPLTACTDGEVLEAIVEVCKERRLENSY